MDSIKKELKTIFKEIMFSKLSKSQNQVLASDFLAWRSLDLDFKNHDNMDYIAKVKPFLSTIMTSLEERAFLDEVWKVVSAYENNHYLIADSSVYEQIVNHVLFISIISKLKLKKEEFLKQDGIKQGTNNDIYTVQKIIDSLEGLEDGEYIYFVDYINDFLYSDNSLNNKEKFQINYMILQYNMAVSKSLSTSLKEEINRLKLK